MQRGRLIIAGGEAPVHLSLDWGYESITAADSGYDTALSLGFKPGKVVGDLDSTERREELIALGVKPVKHDKDYTDLEMAIFQGSGPYDLIGCGGGRLDHTLAALASFRKYGGPDIWWTKEDVVYKLSGPVRIICHGTTTFSFFSLAPEPVNVRSDGLVWELDGYALSPLDVSLSNRNRKDEVLLFPEGEAYMRLPIAFFPLEIEDA